MNGNQHRFQPCQTPRSTIPSSVFTLQATQCRHCAEHTCVSGSTFLRDSTIHEVIDVPVISPLRENRRNSLSTASLCHACNLRRQHITTPVTSVPSRQCMYRGSFEGLIIVCTISSMSLTFIRTSSLGFSTAGHRKESVMLRRGMDSLRCGAALTHVVQELDSMNCTEVVQIQSRWLRNERDNSFQFQGL